MRRPSATRTLSVIRTWSENAGDASDSSAIADARTEIGDGPIGGRAATTTPFKKLNFRPATFAFRDQRERARFPCAMFVQSCMHRKAPPGCVKSAP